MSVCATRLWPAFKTAAAALTNAAIDLYNQEHPLVPTKLTDKAALLSSLGSVARYFDHWAYGVSNLAGKDNAILGAAAARLYQIDGNLRNYQLSLKISRFNLS